MSKKKLQVEGIMNELEGASLFFKQPVKPAIAEATPISESHDTPPSPSMIETPVLPKLEISEPEIVNEPTDTTASISENKTDIKSNKQTSTSASKQASTQSRKAYDLVETIRKTVKPVGKEVFFVRVTPEEKRVLGSIVYSFNEMYSGEGRKTSENEVGRIALNFLLEDYRENGNNSILARVLAALNA